MRRIVTILAALAFSAGLSAQVQITTKKEKLSDFPTKTMKVVLSGNHFIDPALREAVNNVWSLSPFEFCTMQEFKSLMTNEEYYFLVPVKARFKKETQPGIMMLTLAKGKAGAEEINDLLEVASIPICAADIPSGREAAMLPGLMDILQDYVGQSLQSSFSGLGSYCRPLSRISGKSAVIAESDIAPSVDSLSRARLMRKGLEIVTDETADSLFLDGSRNAVVSYAVVPTYPQKGSWRWVFLIDARTHELFYFKKARVSGTDNAGFLKGDLTKISKAL